MARRLTIRISFCDMCWECERVTAYAEPASVHARRLLTRSAPHRNGYGCTDVSCFCGCRLRTHNQAVDQLMGQAS